MGSRDAGTSPGKDAAEILPEPFSPIPISTARKLDLGDSNIRTITDE